ncbi:MAG: GNAT family N-acetyltransferase [Clostridiales bacterium]|nr:GNAT family N-acetyltransferase [Clostridiales bacterium]
MYRRLDEKYKNEFCYDTSDIVFLSNNQCEYIETYIASDLKWVLLPLSYMVTFGRVGCLQIKNTIEFFEGIDNDFERFLGINKCKYEEDAVERIHQLLIKERDNMHKYYLIGKDPISPTGIFYIYNYKAKHKTCDIGIGLSKEYRGENLCSGFILEICKQLVDQGINRIGMEVETTNASSTALCNKKLLKMGFEYEGVRRNSYGIGIDSLVYSFIAQ